jgi:hypothetical protein
VCALAIVCKKHSKVIYTLTSKQCAHTERKQRKLAQENSEQITFAAETALGSASLPMSMISTLEST